MASSRLSGINVVSWIIGSGLIVFAINTIYVDFIKTPDIRFEINEENRTSSSISMDVWAANFGMIPAHNITLAIETYDLPIMGLGSPLYEEDIRAVKSNIENPNKAVIKVPRLSSLGHGVNHEITLAIPTNDVGFHNINRDIDIFVGYEEGNNVVYYYVDENTIGSYNNPSDKTALLKNLVPYSIIAILLILAAITLVIPKIYKKVKPGKYKKIYDIIEEISMIKNILRVNILSKQMLPNEALYREIDGRDIKTKIFDNYDDYKQIDELSKQIEKRDQHFLNNPTNIDTVKEYNRKTLLLASDALKYIEWKKYYSSNKTIMNAAGYIAIFLGSILIFFAPDLIIEGLVPSLFYLPGQIALATYISIIFVIRTLISFLIAKAITRYELSKMEVSSGNELYLIPPSEHYDIKLLLFSSFIVGIPIPGLIIGDDLLASFYLDLMLNEIGIMFYAIDLVRMGILILLTRKLVVKIKISDNTESDIHRSAI